jgi:2-dehydro-3-deoxyphosphogalactonate aldolase
MPVDDQGAAPWPAVRRGLVAILRGVTPDQAPAIGEALLDAGFEVIEVPLNSPDPFRSIKLLAALGAARKGGHVLIGAGTVLTPDAVDAVAAAGGRLIVSPNVDAAVIGRARERGLVSMPGVFTPTEAFAALAAGASGLKFFPASILGPSGIAAIKAVLPKGALVAAVGGVGDADYAAYAKIGVSVFGLGSGLYRPGATAADVATRARAAVTAYDAAFPKEC